MFLHNEENPFEIEDKQTSKKRGTLINTFNTKQYSIWNTFWNRRSMLHVCISTIYSFKFSYSGCQVLIVGFSTARGFIKTPFNPTSMITLFPIRIWFHFPQTSLPIIKPKFSQRIIFVALSFTSRKYNRYNWLKLPYVSPPCPLLQY